MPLEFVGMDASPHIIEIWADAFPDDSRGDIEDFLALALNDRSCAVWVHDGRPVSMAFFLPALLKTERGDTLNLRYVYAAATLTPYRGRGLFGKLLTQAHEKLRGDGVDACFLHPASPGLFDYYKRFGYYTRFYVNEKSFTVKELSCRQHINKHDIKLNAVGGYAAGRNAFLREYPAWVRWPEELAGYAARLALNAGGAVLSDGGCVALCEPRKNELFIREWLCRAEDGDALISALASRLGFETVTLRQPVMRSRHDDSREFGMICPLNDRAADILKEIADFPAYMGLAFD